MRRVLSFAGLLFAPLAVAADPKPATPFDPTKLWEFHVTLTKAEYDAIQPPQAAFGFGQPPPPPPAKRDDGREVHQNVFGVDLVWGKGSVTADGQTFENVGIRYKGNGTILESNGKLKKSIKK